MGSSAGGFGTLATYPLFRWYWPDAEGLLVDDSGPPLVGDDIPAPTRAGWWRSWGLAGTVGAFCPECEQDLSRIVPNLAGRHPGDRLALLSYVHDPVIETFFGTAGGPMDPVTFARALRRLGEDVFSPLATARYFYALPPTIDGAHVMLDAPRDVPGLGAWLDALLSPAGAGWVNVSPPLDVIPAVRASARGAPRGGAASRARAGWRRRSGSPPPPPRAPCPGSACSPR
jgi:hypothetical protein